MEFRSSLILQDIDGLNWIVDAPLVWSANDGKQFTVPVGFKTDLATLGPFRKIFRSSGDWNKAAVLHDFLYTVPIGQLDRKIVDNYFLEALEDCGVGYWTRYAMYWAVRVYGVFRWRK
jgi:hypothetical protein